MTESDDPRRFDELSTPACLDRLRSASIGRVGWNTVDGPQVLPVTYTLHHQRIVFRTSAYGPLADLKDSRLVAFEVDDFDPKLRTGWSVLVRGRSRAASRSEELVELWHEADPLPWAGGNRNLFITIRADQVTGRAVRREAREGFDDR